MPKNHASPDPKSLVERRVNPRYKFSASIEIVEGNSKTSIRAQVGDLGRLGCYVDTKTPLALGTVAKVRITKGPQVFESQARVVFALPSKGMGLAFTVTHPDQSRILESWISAVIESSWLAANRRHSQRMLLDIPVQIHGRSGAGTAFEEDANTMAISAHGALIPVAAPLRKGQKVSLTNSRTKAVVECVVVHIGQSLGNRVQVGVSFILPNPMFWRVAFPPADWSPHHPDAK